MTCAGFLFTSCEKDEIGGAATKSLAGEWTVTVDAVDENGNIVMEDPYGLGRTMVNTYNTSANVPTEMFVDDMKNFWNYKVRVQSNINSLTFATSGAVANEADECDVTIDGGKILPGAATTPHSTPADSIVYYVSFSDDDAPAQNGFAKYKVSGYRYTGLAVDD